MTEALPEVTIAELVAAGREPPAAFALRLRLGMPAGLGSAADGTLRIECRQILRLLPGRRLVLRVSVAGRCAVLKLFLGPGAARYCRRERAGCVHIAAAGIATPDLLGEVQELDGTVAARGLLFEFIEAARGLTPDEPRDLQDAVVALARLHAAGCRHRDLHLDNFLRSPAGVYLIDGDGVRRMPWRPGRSRALNDLALLCAQRPPLADATLPDAYRTYARTRGWPADDPAAVADVARRTRLQRHHRVRRYLQKAQRDCSEFLCRRTWRRYLVAVRGAWDEALAGFAADPERAFAAATVLKAGNSATVVRLALGDATVVVKRYNHKNRWQALRRNLRPMARFRRAWCNGQRLHMLHVPTARPLLLLERRWGPLRGLAYLVMEDLGDTDLAGAAAHAVDERILTGAVNVLRALDAAGLVHGDTKASNFLLRDGTVALVDLDAMHVGANRADDRRRFLANFAADPGLQERFRRALQEAGLV